MSLYTRASTDLSGLLGCMACLKRCSFYPEFSLCWLEFKLVPISALVGSEIRTRQIQIQVSAARE